MAWTWQLCSEFGEFQTTQAHSSPATNIVTEHYDVASTMASFCHGPFPYAPAYPDVSAAVGKYGSWGMRPSNVMFTNATIAAFCEHRTFAVSNPSTSRLKPPFVALLEIFGNFKERYLDKVSPGFSSQIVCGAAENLDEISLSLGIYPFF
ncbi:hypothetical protein VE00_00046 [Pseudogymnoascus sp. WSF 3629]|nr:hypothetical protein VE00_00046 [Pseudogymnoascus sp. WSF 3629]